MKTPLPNDGEIEAVERLGLEALREVWRTWFGPPPPLRSVPLLRLCLAWRLQALAHGGLDKETRRKFSRSGPVQPEGLELGVGTKLRRRWKGRTVEVVVAQDSFIYEGERFPSLSAAATAIAGSRWNGPRFFGLRDTAP